MGFSKSCLHCGVLSAGSGEDPPINGWNIQAKSIARSMCLAPITVAWHTEAAGTMICHWRGAPKPMALGAEAGSRISCHKAPKPVARHTENSGLMHNLGLSSTGAMFSICSGSSENLFLDCVCLYDTKEVGGLHRTLGLQYPRSDTRQGRRYGAPPQPRESDVFPSISCYSNRFLASFSP